MRFAVRARCDPSRGDGRGHVRGVGLRGIQGEVNLETKVDGRVCYRVGCYDLRTTKRSIGWCHQLAAHKQSTRYEPWLKLGPVSTAHASRHGDMHPKCANWSGMRPNRRQFERRNAVPRCGIPSGVYGSSRAVCEVPSHQMLICLPKVCTLPSLLLPS